jgi:hypothetical protein
VAAILRGDWAPLETRVRRGVACLRHHESLEEEAAVIDLEEEAREFRYARNLLTAEETELWLGRNGLSFEEWSDYLERSAVMRAYTGKRDPSGAESDSEIGLDEVRTLIRTDAVCSGEWERLAAVLASRAALYESQEDKGSADDGGPSPEDLARARQACASAFGSTGLAGLRLDGWADRVPQMVRLEVSFQARTQAAQTDAAIRGEIEGHRVEWTRVDWRYLELAADSVAREALLCLREDGAPLAEVAARARVPVREETLLLESVDSAARTALLAAKPGDVLGPLPRPEGFRVALVTAKAPPSEEDANVRRRAEEQIVASLIDREKRKRVRWHATF